MLGVMQVTDAKKQVTYEWFDCPIALTRMGVGDEELNS
jgi:hypothetical protein